jgi:homoserine O-acetyltransferase
VHCAPAFISYAASTPTANYTLELATSSGERIDRTPLTVYKCAQMASDCSQCLALDPKWRDGHYYDAQPGDGPHAGLALARMVSQVTFRSDDVFTDRFGREPVEPLAGRFEMWQRFQVERYLDYHGAKLARRFDANSYLLLTKAMDLHDIARGRGGEEAALRRITAPTLSIGISSDILYPSYQQRDLADGIEAAGGSATYVELDSPHGHDAFLIEIDQVAAALVPFLEKPLP